MVFTSRVSIMSMLMAQEGLKRNIMVSQGNLEEIKKQPIIAFC
jgi:hypothetical protein